MIYLLLFNYKLYISISKSLKKNLIFIISSNDFSLFFLCKKPLDKKNELYEAENINMII
jgi:hypothetical protein